MNQTTIAFHDEIKMHLSKYLERTVWNTVDQIDERVTRLMNIQSVFIHNVSDKLSAEDIAKSLFIYDKKLRNRL